jgi:hypothetical protein
LCQDVLKTLDDTRIRISGESGMKDFVEFANQKGMFNFAKRFNKIQGSKFTNVVMDDAMDMYTSLYVSTRDVVKKVKPFFEGALRIASEREGG